MAIAIRKAVLIIAGWGIGMSPLASAWGAVLDFDDLAGKPVPDDYGGLNWVDTHLLENKWIVDAHYLPQFATPCTLFDVGETPVEVTISSATPFDFISIQFAGVPGDTVRLFGDGPGEERYGVDYYSGTIELDGSTPATYEELWLEITELTIYFDSLFPGSIFIDNLTFQPSPRLATIFREDFDAFTSNENLTGAGWERQHGQYIPEDGGSWHIERGPLGSEGVSGTYVISSSAAEGELLPLQVLDERLLSPEIDCTNFTDVHLQFRHNLKIDRGNDSRELFNVHVSTAPGYDNWQSNRVPFWSWENFDSVYPQAIDISQFADGKKIKIRWRYWADFDYWWAIDEVRVIGRPKKLDITDLQVNAATREVSLAWDAPDGVFSIEASSDATFSTATERATGITEKQWTGADPGVSDGKRFYKVRMD